MNRRDWFRLRTESRKPLLGNGETSEQQPTFSAIEHPPNHDGMAMSDLPPMREAMLTSQQVELLCSDIENHGSNIQLMQRGKSAQTSAHDAPALQSARQALLNGQANKLQIRYRWNDSLWIDTLNTTDDGFRLVRIVHQNF